MQSFRVLFPTVAAVGLLASVATPVQADVEYRYAFAESSLQLLPGEVRSVDIFLEEAVSPPDTSILADEDGLASAQVTITRLSSLASSPARITDLTANTAEFNDISGPDISFTDASGSILEYVDILETSGPDGSPPSAGVRRIPLGSVELTAGLIIGETTSFEAADDPSFDDTITFGGTQLDDLIAAVDNPPLTVTVVPEPGLGLLSLGLLGVGCMRRTAPKR